MHLLAGLRRFLILLLGCADCSVFVLGVYDRKYISLWSGSYGCYIFYSWKVGAFWTLSFTVNWTCPLQETVECFHQFYLFIYFLHNSERSRITNNKIDALLYQSLAK